MSLNFGPSSCCERSRRGGYWSGKRAKKRGRSLGQQQQAETARKVADTKLFNELPPPVQQCVRSRIPINKDTPLIFPCISSFILSQVSVPRSSTPGVYIPKTTLGKGGTPRGRNTSRDHCNDGGYSNYTKVYHQP